MKCGDEVLAWAVYPEMQLTRHVEAYEVQSLNENLQ